MAIRQFFSQAVGALRVRCAAPTHPALSFAAVGSLSTERISSTANEQSGSQLLGGFLSSVFKGGFRNGNPQRCLDGGISPVSARGFSSAGIFDSGFVVRNRSENVRAGGTGTVSYSSLALDSRESSRGLDFNNAAEIGYKVMGPYVPDESTKIQRQAAFAVVQVGSHQFKVSPGDMIYTEKLKFADINDQLCLNKVLLLGSLKRTIIGRPIIPEAAVLAAVEEHALDAKVIIFKKKRRKNYRRTNGHRQELTRLRILRIDGIEDPTPLSSGETSREESD